MAADWGLEILYSVQNTRWTVQKFRKLYIYDFEGFKQFKLIGYVRYKYIYCGLYQEECAILQENVPEIKLRQYN